jgi:hypothetical protein
MFVKPSDPAPVPCKVAPFLSALKSAALMPCAENPCAFALIEQEMHIAPIVDKYLNNPKRVALANWF